MLHRPKSEIRQISNGCTTRDWQECSWLLQFAAYQNSRRRIAETLPQPLPDISRENILKILGVTITHHLSASEHIRQIISDSAQSLYALRVLRHHGMTEIGLHAVFRAVVVSRLTYASPVWSGFITVTDCQRVDAFLNRTVPATSTTIYSITEL